MKKRKLLIMLSLVVITAVVVSSCTSYSCPTYANKSDEEKNLGI